MIKFSDGILLAYTKLRTRKIRLSITIFISAILFSVLATASLVVRGAFNSTSVFSKEGLGGRYIIMATPNSSNNDPFTDKTVIANAKNLQEDLIKRKKEAAKKLGYDYDPKLEVPALTEYEDATGKHQQVNFDSAVGKQAMQQYMKSHPAPGLPELKKLASPHKPIGYYKSQVLFSYGEHGELKVLKNGKENFEANPKPSQGPPTGLDSFSENLSQISDALVEPFVLEGSSLKAAEDGKVPILAPYSAAEQILGLKTLPATATSEQKLARLKEVRTKAANTSFGVCYRNNASGASIGEAISQQQDIKANKKNKDYVMPQQVYKLPTEPCAAVTIAKDTRSAETKKLDAKIELFNKMFGQEDPASKLITFKIVGLIPDISAEGAAGISQLLQTIVSSYIGSGWFIPSDAAEANPTINNMFKAQQESVMFSGLSTFHYVELSNEKDARALLAQSNCGSNAPPDVAITTRNDNCKNSPYFMSPYGSNSLALSDLSKAFGRIFNFAALAVALIAAIIMVGTVGRIIADSRRETAVFRAIGSKRSDITQIYLTYTVMLSLIIFCCALIVSFLAAQWINHKYSPDLSVSAAVVYNSSDLTRKFSLFSLYGSDILKLIALVILAGLASASLPLLTNMRRNPINDMRDER